MNRATCLHVPAGQIADRSVIEAVMKAYPTAVGFSLQHEGKLVTESHLSTDNITAANLIEAMTIAKEGHKHFFFANLDKLNGIEDVMPFVVTNDEGATMLSIMYDGNFDKYAGLNGNHTAEFCVADEILFDKIGKAWEEAGKDFEKFVGILKSDKFKKILNTTFDKRGWFMFMPYTGAPWAFGANETALGTTWGVFSNGEGIELPKPVAAAAPAASGGLSFLTGRTGSTPPPQPEATPKEATPATADPAPAKETPIPPNEKIAWVPIKCPAQLTGGARNFWYRLFNGIHAKGLNFENEGVLAPDYQAASPSPVPIHPSLVSFATRNVTNQKEIRQLAEEVKKAFPAGIPVSPVQAPPAATPAAAPSPASRSTVREPFTGTAGNGSSEFTPTMTMEQKEKAMAAMVEFLSISSEKRPSPLDLQKMESKYTAFSSDIGCKFEELLLVPPDRLLKIFDGSKPAVAAYCEIRRKYIETSGIDLEALVAATKADEAKVKAAAAAPVVAAAPTGTGGLSFLTGRSAA